MYLHGARVLKIASWLIFVFVVGGYNVVVTLCNVIVCTCGLSDVGVSQKQDYEKQALQKECLHLMFTCCVFFILMVVIYISAYIYICIHIPVGVHCFS